MHIVLVGNFLESFSLAQIAHFVQRDMFKIAQDRLDVTHAHQAQIK